MIKNIGFLLLAGLLLVSCGDDDKEHNFVFPPEEKPEPPVEMTSPRYVWIDAAANFKDFANSKENIARDLAKAKDAGFTDIVVDVRPSMGDVLYATNKIDQVTKLDYWDGPTYKFIERTATWDYLQAFIDEGHKCGLKVHAAFNTMTAGNHYNYGLGEQGLLFRDASKKDWATSLNLESGITNVMDVTGELVDIYGTKFFNPANDEVQNFLCGLLGDLAKYDLDGIFLDRGRYDDLRSDFSDVTRQKFEAFLGEKIINFPADILPAGATSLPETYPQHMQKWIEFRAKVMHDFMEKARAAVKAVNPKIQFGVYVGAWYSDYYGSGVNWASPAYNASAFYNWASIGYKDAGYADMMDQMLLGAYASPNKVTGTTEWTMQGFCTLALAKIMGACPVVCGGPDVGNWDADNAYTEAQENAAIVESVGVCCKASNGYFLFDMCHLRSGDKWQYVKKGMLNAGLIQ